MKRIKMKRKKYMIKQTEGHYMMKLLKAESLKGRDQQKENKTRPTTNGQLWFICIHTYMHTCIQFFLQENGKETSLQRYGTPDNLKKKNIGGEARSNTVTGGEAHHERKLGAMPILKDEHWE